MTARITGFISRADGGLRKPRSISKNITPASGGVAVHYGGGASRGAEPNGSHAECIKTWKFWQDYHMDTKGWVDIAYTGGFCNHGFAFAGRGAGVRTAANGTNDGNQRFYAVTWIGGAGQKPTPQAYDALEWWISQLRGQGAGRKVKPHRYFKRTGCPGAELSGYTTRLDNRDISSAPAPDPTPPPVPKEQPDVTVFIFTDPRDDNQYFTDLIWKRRIANMAEHSDTTDRAGAGPHIKRIHLEPATIDALPTVSP